MTKEKQRAADATWIGDLPNALSAIASFGTRYVDSDDFLLSPDAFDQSLYVVDLVQRGVSGADLVRLIRRRTTAGVIALSAAPHQQFAYALENGADAVVDRDAPAEHVAAAIAAVRRRIAMASTNASGPWRLRQRQSTLLAPDGAEITLSPGEVTLLHAFVQAEGGVVERSEMIRRLWGPDAGEMDGALQAALYRLRKRVEQAGQPVWPAHSVAGVGYEFRAPLLMA